MPKRRWKRIFGNNQPGSEAFRGQALFRHEYLRVYSGYYRSLSPRLQQKFQVRQARLLDHLRFESDPEFHVTQGMETLISGAIIQVTLGLRRFIPTYFRKIYVTPSSYTYPSIGLMMKGDVNISSKQMTLSWPAVKEGFLIEDDAQNTALHEVSHCLDLETTFFGQEGHFFSERHWEDWEEKALQRLANQLGRPVSFHSHHASLKELFANTVEAFFERPHGLQKLSPPIYQSVSKLLRQDPRNKEWPVR